MQRLSAHLASSVLALTITAIPSFAQDHDHLSSPTVLPHNIPEFCATPNISSLGTGNWSDPTKWSLGRVPQADDIVNVVAGQTITYDSTSSAAIKCIGVNGQLVFRTDINTSLKVGTLMVMSTGTLQIGTAAAPVAPNITAEVIIANQPLVQATDPGQFGTGLIGFGKITMHGSAKTQTFMRLNAEPLLGATTLTLSQAVSGWKVDDRLVIPDTRHLKFNEVNNFRTINPQWEERTISAISGDGLTITLNAGLTHSHLGARDHNNTLRFLPHVGNLSRNVSVRSEVPIGGVGTQGHIIFVERADVDIRYSQFKDLGRTLAFPPCETSGCGFTGGNQIGRYPMHFHHLMGPVSTPSNGYQYTFVGNAVDGGSTVHDRRWGIAIHNTHYGLVKDNVVYNYGGASIATEDGSETQNVIEHNFAMRGRGNGGRLGDGNEGMGFWFRGTNNFIRQNVAANFDSDNAEGAYGYKFFMRQLGTIQIPTAKGQDPSQYVPISGNTLPVLEFSDNEIYGAAQGGITYWWLNCQDPVCNPTATETVFLNFHIWHVFNVGIYHYPGAHVTFDGLVVLGKDPAIAACCGRGFHGEDYSANDVKIVNSEIQGMINGIIPSTAGTGLQTVENTYLNNEHDVVMRTLYSANGGGWLPPRHTVFRNVQFEGDTTIDMDWGPQPAPQGNISQLDEVLVYSYRGNSSDNFRVFYNEQLTQNVAGGLVTCPPISTHPEIFGVVCAISTSALAPTVVSISPTFGPSAGGTAVTITGTGFSTGATVSFGSTSASNVVVNSATTITAVTPALPAGTVNVVVRNIDGLSGTGSLSGVNAFTYTGCTYSLGSSGATVAADGGPGSVSVTAGAGCTWSASSNAAWLTSSSSGSGNGTVNYTAAANGGGARSATLSIGTQTFTVNQNAATGCTFVLASSSQSFSTAAGGGTVNITTGAGCTWTATSNASWIATTSSGTGNGTIGYTVAANTGGSRSGTFTVGGQTFTVNQAASGSAGTLVAAYGFSEGSGLTTADLTGNGHTGALGISGPIWTSGGKFGAGTSYDGVNDLLTIPDSALLDLTSTGTVEAWIKLDTLNTWNGIYGKATSSNDAHHSYAAEINPSNHFNCVIGNGLSFNVATSTSTLQAATFYHVACAWDGTQLRVFINGVLNGSTAQTLTPTANNAALVFGQYGGNVDYLDGIIDEVRVYSRALIASEIVTDMNTAVAAPPVNHAPQLTNPGNQTHQVGAIVALQLAGTDQDGDTLTYACHNPPPGLVLNPATGLISGTPTTAGVYSIAISVSDNFASANVNFTWTVTDVDPTNHAPQLTNPGNQTHHVGDIVALQLAGGDQDGDSLTYSGQNLPTGLTLNNQTGLVSGTPSTVGSYAVAFSVSDGPAQASINFSWDISATNHAPQLTNPGDQTKQVGAFISLQLAGSDADDDTLTYACLTQPPGLTLNTQTGVISGTPTTVGVYPITISVSDGFASTNVSFTWNITAVAPPPANHAPQLTSPGDQVHAVGATVSLQLLGIDPDADTLTYAGLNVPPGLTLNTQTGLISGTPTTAGVDSVTISVSDGSASTNVSFTWTITGVTPPPVNHAPQITNPGDRAHQVGASVSLQLVASDADGDTLIYACLAQPPGLTLNAQTGVISGTPTTAGAYPITISVSDGFASTNVSFTWNITAVAPPPANHAPQLTSPGAQAHTVGDSVSLQLVASDEDGDTLTYGGLNVPPGLTLNTQTGLISGTPTTAGVDSVTISVSDNSAATNVTFTWTITSTPAPTTISLDRTALAFGAVKVSTGLAANTPAQQIRVSMSGPALAWTASSTSPWIQITGGGTGNGTFTVAVVAHASLPATGPVTGQIQVAASGATNTPQVVSVTLTLFALGSSTAAFGAFDTPANGATGLVGAIPVTGWTLDDVNVTRVELWRNCVETIDRVLGACAAAVPGGPANFVFIGNGVFLAEARPDVEASFASAPLAYRAGWGYLMLTNALPHRVLNLPQGGQGTFTLTAYSVDVEGHYTLLGNKTITLTNDTATIPFGNLDTPEQGTTVPGATFPFNDPAAYPVFGWGMTQLGKCIDTTSTASYRVYIDGVQQTLTPGVNWFAGLNRADLAAAFPGLCNSTDGLAAYFMDVRPLSNGIHTIGWDIIDDLGNVAGIGSRFFIVAQ